MYEQKNEYTNIM